MPNQQQQVDLPAMLQHVRIMPDTLNEENRTVQVQYTTGAGVKRYMRGDPYIEELSLEPGHVRLERLNNGAPVLNAHSQWDMRSVIGVVEQADEQYATLRYSKNEQAEPIFQDVKDGIMRNVSVGYVVYKYQDVTPEDSEIRILKAIDWEPLEISMVPVGADAGATVRSKDLTNPCTIIAAERGNNPNQKKGEIMEDDLKEKNRAEDKNSETQKDDVQRAMQDGHKAGAEAEKQRISDIKAAVRKAGLSDDLAEEYIAKDITVERARELVIDALADKDDDIEIRSKIVITKDEREKRSECVENALMHRLNPSKVGLTDGGKTYRHLSLIELARDSLEVAGEDHRTMSKMEIAGRAMHSTSDFPFILENIVNKTLRDAYDNSLRTFISFCRRVSLTDFKEKSSLALSDAPDLVKVVEGGEYKTGTLSEGKEKYKLSTYGRIVRMTRELIVNDDLDAFARVPQKFAAASARLEADLVYAILTGNPKMSDNVDLFHATHKNLTNAQLGVDGLGAIRTLMRTQLAPNSKTPLNIVPEFLIVPAALETEAAKLQAAITPDSAANSNPYRNSYQLIVEGRLDAASPSNYYMAANPDQMDTIEYGYLDGQEGPYIESRESFNTDGLEIKCRHDFVAKPVEFRGLAKSTNDAS